MLTVARALRTIHRVGTRTRPHTLRDSSDGIAHNLIAISSQQIVPAFAGADHLVNMCHFSSRGRDSDFESWVSVGCWLEPLARSCCGRKSGPHLGSS